MGPYSIFGRRVWIMTTIVVVALIVLFTLYEVFWQGYFKAILWFLVFATVTTIAYETIGPGPMVRRAKKIKSLRFWREFEERVLERELEEIERFDGSTVAEMEYEWEFEEECRDLAEGRIEVIHETMGSRKIRVVPYRGPRSYREPYMASDGIMTVHQDENGHYPIYV